MAVVAVLSSFPSVTYGGTVAQEKVYVGLNNRTLYLMSADNDLLFKAGIVAGAPDTPTFTGKFKLGDWEKDKTSKRWGVLSETPWSKSAIGANVFGAYFVPILKQNGSSENGEGIHGKFGNTLLLEQLYETIKRYSHGCVRLSNPDVMRFHDLIPDSRNIPLEIDNFVDPTLKNQQGH